METFLPQPFSIKQCSSMRATTSKPKRCKVASEPRDMCDEYPRILDAAVSVLAKKGFRVARNIDVAARAASANRSIQLSFHNKPRRHRTHGCSRFRCRHHLIEIRKVSSSHKQLKGTEL
jgi:hypothetical protein